MNWYGRGRMAMEASVVVFCWQGWRTCWWCWGRLGSLLTLLSNQAFLSCLDPTWLLLLVPVILLASAGKAKGPNPTYHFRSLLHPCPGHLLLVQLHGPIHETVMKSFKVALMFAKLPSPTTSTISPCLPTFMVQQVKYKLAPKPHQTPEAK